MDHPTHHVLLVDDDADVLEALGTFLELRGIDVERAPSAFAALQTLQTGRLPCVVLLDIRMPGMTGWDLWAWMQREPTTAGLPVVMISGEGQDREAARAKGIVDVLRKPVDAERLEALVVETCAARS